MATSGSLNFLSSSEICIQQYNSTPPKYYYSPINYNAVNWIASSKIPVDFVGLNTCIYDPISSSINTLGHAPSSMTDVENYNYQGGLVFALPAYDMTEGDSLDPRYHRVLAGLLHHRNGPYQHAMWKQWRGAEHPVARYQRLHNTMSIDTRNPQPIWAKHKKHGLNDNYGPEGPPGYHTTVFSGSVSIQKLEQFYEPSVISKYKPFIYDVPINIGNISTNERARARQSLFNQMTFFSNKGLNNALKLSNANPMTSSQFTRNKQKVYSLFHVAQDLGASRFVFHETIYPRSINAYRKYKLHKPDYEETSGYNGNGYDRNHGIIRSFWRNVPSSSLSHNKTERLRTVELALNSQDVTQSMKYTPAPESLSEVYDHGIAWRFDADGDGNIDADDLGAEGIVPPGALTKGLGYGYASNLSYLPNGIVTNQGLATGSSALLQDFGLIPPADIGPLYSQIDSHQPYQINLNSMWPLDAVAYSLKRTHEAAVEDDGISSGQPARYYYWSHGAAGTEIGLTPNAIYGNFDLLHDGSPQTPAILKSGSFDAWNPARITWPTRSAGELVYSTKPTIFFYRQLPSSITTTGNFKHGPIGYNAATASMQYLRHTYPYQSPWYVANLILSQSLGPMYDTYNDFIGNDLKYISRDYSAIPEFRISEHYDFYDDITKLYKQSPTSKVFDVDEYYDETLGVKNFLVKRNFRVKSYAGHKLDFLTLHGADVTSSSDVADSMAQLQPTADRWAYDDIKNFRLTDNTREKKHYQNISGSVYFNQRFLQTDDIKNFTYLMHAKGFGPDVVPSEISFECDIIKKLLPYEGFYPMTRTLQIGSYFKKAFEDHIEDGYNFKNDFKDSDTYPDVGCSESTGSNIIGVDGVFHDSISDDGAPGGQTSDSNKQARMQALLEPFFAPGLLYNSIKSGIAVDYPVYLQKPPQYYGSCMSASYSINAAVDIDGLATSQGLTLTTGSLGHGGYQMMGVANAMPAYLMSRPDYRMPFEALYNMEKMDRLSQTSPSKTPYSNFLVSDFLWGSGSNRITGKKSDQNLAGADQGSLDYTPNVHLKQRASNINTTEMRRYESSINNFLAETMEFFLEPYNKEKNIRFPIVTTGRRKRMMGTVPGVSYYMDLRLEMGEDHVMCEGPRRSNFIFSSSIPYAEGPLSSSLRGYLYGPPMQTIPTLESTPGSTVGDKSGSGSHHHFDFESAFAANLTDPAYQAWTPPYFYGDSIITFKFKPNEIMTPFKEAYKSIITSSFYFEKYNVSGGLTPKLPSTGSISSGSYTRMKIDASIDMFNEPLEFDPLPGFGGDDTYVWYAMPKWICPVLDFSSSYSSHIETINYNDDGSSNFKVSSLYNPYHDETTGRSMWGGYGTDSYDKNMMSVVASLSGKSKKTSKGIYFSLAETFASDIYETSDTPGYVSDLLSPDGYYIKRDSFIKSSLTASLIDVLFEPNQKEVSYEIGKVADNKNISEAIAIIPYFENPLHLQFRSVTGFENAEEAPANYYDKILNSVFQTREMIPGKHFLGIHDNTFEKILSVLLIEKLYNSDSIEYERLTKNWLNHTDHGQSTLSNAINCDVGRMISNLIGPIDTPDHRGYQLPPEFDFIHNAHIAPFQMIIVPFEQNLSKQDLISVYQGIMPRCGLRAEKAFNKINAHPGLQHAIDDPNLISSFTTPAPSEGTGQGDPGGRIMLTEFNLANFLSPLPLISDLKNTIADSINEATSANLEALPTGIQTSKQFYEEMKFMVFKIKRRGVANYRRYKEKNLATHVETNTFRSDGENLKIKNLSRSHEIFADEIYGMNWPYDNFSLIETVKIDTKIKVE